MACQVLEKRWKLHAVDVDAEVVGRTATWHRNMFKQDEEKWSLPLDEADKGTKESQILLAFKAD